MSIALPGVDGDFELISKFSKDMRAAAGNLTVDQARYLVDLYYQAQDFRIQAASRNKAFVSSGEPNLAIQWVMETFEASERNIKNALGRFARQYRVGVWLQSLTGIGDVISAGLLAHLDVRGRPMAGHFWSFAGLNPTAVWEKGKRRPWNASLKLLCYKAGESFVKVQNLDSDYYGKLFVARKAAEWERNLAGDYVADCKVELDSKSFGKDTAARQWYEGKFTSADARAWLDTSNSERQETLTPPKCESGGQPMMPPGRIHARARRWVVKLFLSHLHHVMFEDYYGNPPNRPYAFDQLKNQDHRHYLEPPSWPISEGRPLRELLDRKPVKPGKEST